VEITVDLVSQELTTRIIEGDANVTFVPAGDVTLIVQGSSSSSVRLDGRLRRLVSTSGGRILSLDLTRSTGVHHLQIAPGHHFWFATTDSKLGIEGLLQMLEYLRNECTSWSGQLLFSSGSELTDPHVIYGWLDQNADAALEAAEAIAARPILGSMRDFALTRRGGKRIDVPRTHKLLRRRPDVYLDEVDGGPLSVGNKTFVPRKVVTTRVLPSMDSMANRRVAWMTNQIRYMADLVANASSEEPETQRCHDWSMVARRILDAPLFRPIRHLAGRTPSTNVPSVVETTDPRYVRVFQMIKRLMDDLGWTPRHEMRPMHSYVQYSDQIYQGFVAAVVAEVLGLGRTSNLLGSTSPAFVSDQWNLYYNVVPPANILASWRSFSATPDNLRPDILLVDRSTGAVVLGDAKFRVDGNHATETSRRELMSYMHAFGLLSAIVFFPLHGEPLEYTSISGEGMTIVEIPCMPAPSLKEFLAGVLPNVLHATSTVPRWTKLEKR
jgi:hypothetical protein